MRTLPIRILVVEADETEAERLRQSLSQSGANVQTSFCGTLGDAIYRSACAGCHEGSRRGIALDHSTSTTDASPANLIRVTLDGIQPRDQ